jgi:hypothetical protein
LAAASVFPPFFSLVFVLNCPTKEVRKANADRECFVSELVNEMILFDFSLFNEAYKVHQHMYFLSFVSGLAHWELDVAQFIIHRLYKKFI